jgi:hypothetical protein
MAVYAVTEILSTGNRVLVSESGRFEFPAEDGPLITSMLDSEWPKCDACEDRECLACERCGESGCLCDCPASEDAAAERDGT